MNFAYMLVAVFVIGPGIADELDVVLEVLEQLELRLGADHGHRLLLERLQERVVVAGRGLHAPQALLVHLVEELLAEVLRLREAVDAVGHRPRAADAQARDADRRLHDLEVLVDVRLVLAPPCGRR